MSITPLVQYLVLETSIQKKKKMNIPLTFELEKFVQGDYRDNHYICH